MDHEETRKKAREQGLSMPEPTLLSRFRTFIDHAIIEGNAYRVATLSIAYSALLLAALGVTAFQVGPLWLRILCSTYVGLWAAIGTLSFVERMQSYRHGWVDGRCEMAASFAEAHDRGMTNGEWYTAEAMRTSTTAFGR